MKKLFLIATVVGTIILTGALISNVAAIEIFTEKEFRQIAVKKEYFVKTADNFIILLTSPARWPSLLKKAAHRHSTM